MLTPIGISIVVAYTILGLAFAGVLYSLIRRWRWRWAIVVPLLMGVALLAAAPFIEEERISAQFATLCKDAGIRILRKAEADGFYDSTMASGYAHIDRLGYAFMEHRAPGRKILHIEKIDGKWVTRLLDRPTARFHLETTRSGEKVGHRIFADEDVVRDNQTGEILGRRTIFSRYLNSIDQKWAGALGSTRVQCPDPARGPPQPSLVDQILIPKRR